MIGSGIAAQTLSPNDVGLQLFENAAATAAGLFTIILMFGPVSGGHFNPVVSLADASFGGIRWRDALAYIPAQVAGCVLGADRGERHVLARRRQHLHPPPRLARAPVLRGDRHRRAAARDLLARAHANARSIAPAAVGAYIGAAYFFTSSASFANPAISVGRMFSNTFAGIAPASVPGYIVAQLVGGVCAILLVRVLYPDVTPAEAAEILLPHNDGHPAPDTTVTADLGA